MALCWKPIWISSCFFVPSISALLRSSSALAFHHQQRALLSTSPAINFWNMDASDSRKSWTCCSECRGEGRLRRGPTRKAKLRHQRAGTQAPQRWEPCQTCQSSGLVEAATDTTRRDEQRSEIAPRVAIIGGGLGGWALAAACRHRKIPVVVYERDEHLNQRAQGYGLTMQQASKALKSFGISELKEGITSTKHIVHNQSGEVVGQWGMRHWNEQQDEHAQKRQKKEPRRQNVHIARQALRYELWKAAMLPDGGDDPFLPTVHMNHRLLSYKSLESGKTQLTFQIGKDQAVQHEADLVVGADGIRSQVRAQLVGDEQRYLECFVMLGICALDLLDADLRCHHLLDGETVFQTADGTTRMYMMPYSQTSYMWQLSFPMPDEQVALDLKTPYLQKAEALRRCSAWHAPIGAILQATPTELVTGYPVYDRTILSAEALGKDASRSITLLGDAAHPMSPFKGQGANQALLDALSLARALSRHNFQENSGELHRALQDYELEMIERTAVKVKASAEAACFLHTDVAIQKGNVTRGAANRQNELA